MVNSKENTTNLKDAKTWFNVGEIITFTRKKRRYWNSWQRRDIKLHCVTLINMSTIPGLYTTIFSLARALQRVFQVMSEDETLIYKKNPTKICFDEKMASKAGKGFLLTIKFYKSAKDTYIFSHKKRNSEGKSDVHPEGRAVKKQKQTTTKKRQCRNVTPTSST